MFYPYSKNFLHSIFPLYQWAVITLLQRDKVSLEERGMIHIFDSINEAYWSKWKLLKKKLCVSHWIYGTVVIYKPSLIQACTPNYALEKDNYYTIVINVFIIW